MLFKKSNTKQQQKKDCVLLSKIIIAFFFSFYFTRSFKTRLFEPGRILNFVSLIVDLFFNNSDVFVKEFDKF